MSTALTHASFGPAAKALRALGDPGRLRLLALISRRELCVCHLISALKQPQPTVSRQLGVLKAAGLVQSRRDGSWVHYRVATRLAPAVAAVLKALLAQLDGAALDAETQALVRKLGPGACK